jgi:hypothetical protein
MYDIKIVIASFLRKLQQNFAQLHRNIFQFTPRNVLYWDFTKKKTAVVIGKKFPNSPNIIV